MKREKIQQLAHILAGLITLGAGFDNFENKDFNSSARYLALALLFIIVAGLHKWISKQFIQSNVAFFLLEALTIFYIGYDYSNKNNLVILWFMMAAGIVFIGFALISINQNDKPRHKSRSKKRRSSQRSTSGI